VGHASIGRGRRLRKVEDSEHVGREGAEKTRTGGTCPDEHLNVTVQDLVERGHGGTRS